MKRLTYIFTLIALMLGMTGSVQAQQEWDFTKSYEEDLTALSAATTEWSYASDKNRYESKNVIDGAITAGGTELTLTRGLTVTAAAKKIRIDVGKRLQLAGKNIPVITPALKKGQKVTIVFASTGETKVTFDELANLSNTQGFVAADQNTTQTGTGTVTQDGAVSFKCTGGSVNIFSIKVTEGSSGDTGDDEPANDHSTVSDPTVSQVILTLTDGTKKYYNTSDASIGVADDVITVNTGNYQDSYERIVSDISFRKGVNDGSGQGEVINVEGKVNITEARGWLESAYMKFDLFEMAGAVVTGYNVYIKGGNYSDYTKIDHQLVRNYGTYGRADMVGLMPGSYDMKVVPVVGENELTSASNEVTGMDVRSYSREGFAFMNGYSPGAYNSDGTLKQGAKVFYVTANTAKTISTTVKTGSKESNIETCTGIQTIIDAYQKGYDTTPIAFRFIGLVTKDDLDHISSSEEGLQIKGKNKDSEVNITIEGIGDDATLKGFGFLVRSAKGVEFRNIGIIRFMDDGISLDNDNSNIWIHHTDIFYGKHGSGDHDKGDGATDLKSDSKYVTVSYNRYWDTGKTNLFGMKSESGPNYISYDHNWFDHSDSRHPRVRTLSVHVWNNYYDNVAKYGVGATYGGSVFVENNYFLKTKKPILSSRQGTDALGSGTFSGENGGMIKAYGNYFDRTAKNFSYYTQHNPASTGYDAYETASRDEQVPASEVTRVGGTPYDNFDTNPSLMYAYTAVPAEDVPALVTGYYGAGRLNHGDFQYSFPDNVGNDDADSNYDTVLGGLLDNYQSSFVGFFGDDSSTDPVQGGETGSETGEEPGGEEPGGGEVTPDDGTILCTFDMSATPSSSLFTVTNGNASNSKGTITVDDKVITICLKIETATSVKFTLASSMKMTLYFGPEETASIKIDGTKIVGSGNTYTTILEAGLHELTKDKSVNLFAIKLEPVE